VPTLLNVSASPSGSLAVSCCVAVAPSSTVMSAGWSNVGAWFTLVTMIWKFSVSLVPSAEDAVADDGYVPSSPNTGDAVIEPVPSPLSVSVANAGRTADNVIASPSGSVALMFRVADAPSATVRLAIGARSTGRFTLFTLMLKVSVSAEPAVVAVADAG
jgi:hypothetical protein